MPLKMIAAPAAEPLTTDEVVAFCRLDDSEAANPLLGLLIKSARRQAEKITGRQLITATWELYLDGFHRHKDWRNRIIAASPNFLPGAYCFDHLLLGRDQVIKLPLPPLQTLNSIKYLDGAGVEQTLAANLYQVDSVKAPARIAPAYNCAWPATLPVMNAVKINFTAGYGSAGENIPEDILNWLRVMVSTLYENRELVVVNNSTVNMVSLPFLDGLLDDYRVWGL